MGRNILVTMALLGACTATADAQQARGGVALASQLFVETVRTDLNGREKRVLQPASKVSSGDRLVYVVRYRNLGTAPVSRFVVTNPVPGQVQLDAMSDSASPARELYVSVDGGSRWGRLGDLTMTTAAGGVRPALPQDVTHVRWSFKTPIRPGATGQLSFRGTVR